MARTKISEFSSTPANNTDIDSINISEGCAPSGINDAIRELMAQLKDFQTGAVGDSFNGPIGSTTASTGAFTTLTTTGNAGIGTSSPAARLHSTSSSNQLTISEGSSLGATFDYQSSTGNLSIATNGINARSSAQLVLNLNGNLGLGVTPSASDFKTLQVGYAGSGLLATGQNDLILASNAYYASGWKYGGSAKANYFELDTGSFKWYQTNTSGTAGNAITFTQAMTLDASGNLGIGTTSPASKLHVVGNTRITADIESTGNSIIYSSNGSAAGTINAGVYLVGSDSSTRFYTGNSERARIDSSGNLLIGLTSITTATSRSYGNAFSGSSSYANWISWGEGTQTHAVFRNGTNQVGSIVTTSTTTTYNTTSDQRLKENIQDATSASDLIDSLQVRQYDWKADGSHQRYGFIAQELVTVAPEAVHQPTDTDEMMAIDYSKLVPMLVKEVQSLRARVAQLEGN